MIAALSPAAYGQQPALTPSGPAATVDKAELVPAMPPGVSENDVEISAVYSYTWQSDGGEQIIECLGDFELRMGQYLLKSHDAVLWFKRIEWRDRPYYQFEVFLWKDAVVEHPGGTVESGDALMPTLRSFGKLILNADGAAGARDDGSELFQRALRVRNGVEPLADESVESDESTPVSSSLLDAQRRRAPRVPKAVSYRSAQLRSVVQNGRRQIIAIGDVYVTQGSPGSGDFFELSADSAVLFLHEGVADGISGVLTPGGSGAVATQPSRAPRGPNDPPPDDAFPTSPEDETLRDETSDRDMAREVVDAVYLEGDVVLSHGSRRIRSSRIYFDLQNNRALILDAVMRSIAESRNVPVYVRAAEIRQLSESQFAVRDATISTSEFHTPHLAIGAEEATLTDQTPRNARGEIIGITAGSYMARNTTMLLDGVPVAWSPYASGEFEGDASALQSISTGYSRRFGGEIETRWNLFNLLGIQKTPGLDLTLRADYFTKKGPGLGLDADYAGDDYYGLFRGYYLNDHGEDDLGGNPQRGGQPDTDDRGRVLWRHRQFFDKGWELTLETAYISDDQFLESYERNEFENGKDQETVFYLVKREQNWQFSTLANVNLNDFLTQTERFPESRFSLLGEPIGDNLTLYHDSRAGILRYDPAQNQEGLEALRPARFRPSNETVRADVREEVQVPLDELGPVKFTPFGSIRGTFWDGSPTGGGGVTRSLGIAGIHGNMFLSRVYENAESRLFDVHRLKHIIKPGFTAWYGDANRGEGDMYPFDSDVEGTNQAGGGAFSLRQRLQTKRGGPGRWRTVDWIVLDLEAGFFDHAQKDDISHGNFIASRPEDSITSNFLSVDFLWRISDTTALLYDGVYDFDRGRMGVSNLSLAYERLPRLATYIGWRYIGVTDSNAIAMGANYKLNEKYTVGFRELYDIDRNRNGDTSLVFVRRWPRWYTAVVVSWDRTVDDFAINLSIWPEGAPNIGLGSKRYTSLGSTVGLAP